MSIYLFRHSNKISSKDWKNMTRSIDNPWDKPLSKLGIDNCVNMAKQITHDNLIIYTSPLSRCIETALHISTYLEKINKKVIIRIENGLSKIIDTDTKKNTLKNSIDNHMMYQLDDKLINVNAFDNNYIQMKPNIDNNNCNHFLEITLLFVVQRKNSSDSFLAQVE